MQMQMKQFSSLKNYINKTPFTETVYGDTKSVINLNQGKKYGIAIEVNKK